MASAVQETHIAIQYYDNKYSLNADKIEAACANCDDGKVGMRQAADVLEVQLSFMGLMQIDVIVHPMQVGFSDINRDGMIGNARDSMDLISIIGDAGCSPEEMKHTTMEEEEPSC